MNSKKERHSGWAPMRVNVRLISSVRVAPSRGLDSELLFIYLSCINDDLEGRRIEIRNSLLSSNGPVISKMRPFIAAVLESESSTPNVCAKWRDIYNIWNLPLNATQLWVSCPWWLQSSLFLFSNWLYSLPGISEEEKVKSPWDTKRKRDKE